MPVSGSKIVAPVNGNDPYDLLGVPKQPSGYDVGYICSNAHGRINLWSKYKPIRHNSIVSPSDAELSIYKWGIDIPSDSYNPDTWYQDTNAPYVWRYYPPRGGGNNEPYRLTDFKDYNHNSLPPIRPRFNTTITIDMKGTKEMVIPFIGNGISIPMDFLDNYYLAILLYTGTFNEEVPFHSNVKFGDIKNSGEFSVTFTTTWTNLKARVYNVKLFLMTKTQGNPEHVIDFFNDSKFYTYTGLKLDIKNVDRPDQNLDYYPSMIIDALWVEQDYNEFIRVAAYNGGEVIPTDMTNAYPYFDKIILECTKGTPRQYLFISANDEIKDIAIYKYGKSGSASRTVSSNLKFYSSFNGSSYSGQLSGDMKNFPSKFYVVCSNVGTFIYSSINGVGDNANIRSEIKIERHLYSPITATKVFDFKPIL